MSSRTDVLLAALLAALVSSAVPADALGAVEPAGRIDVVTVDGPLEPEAVLRLALRHAGQLRSCWERDLKKEPRLDGELTLAVDVSRAGKVTEARVTRCTLPLEDVCSCSARAFRRWRFPEAADRSGVWFRMGYRFREPASAPEVEIGPVLVRGRIAPGRVSRVVHGAGEPWLSCWRGADPGATVDLRLEVGPDGRVGAVTAAAPDAPKLGECVAGVARGLSFGVARGQTATLDVPLRLRGAER